MSSEANKALVYRLVDEAWNKGELAVVDEILAPNFVDHDPTNPFSQDRAGFQQNVRMFRAAFPDAQFTAEDLLAETDKVVLRWHFRGTHLGDLPGLVPATGKSVTMSGIEIFRVAAGQVVEHWAEADSLGFLQQLGVIPSPTQPGG
jgi:steroid delta-isomerase-like uncharacterized protein